MECRRIFITLLAFVMVCLACLGTSLARPVTAFSPQSDCLWISCGDGTREADGSVTLPLQIHFGRFPTQSNELGNLRDIRVRHAIASGGKTASWAYREALVEPTRDGGIVRVRVGANQRFVFQVTAVGIEQGRTIHHCAMTWYQRFGRIKGGSMASAPPDDFFMGPLQIRITPAFNYWRQVGEPLRIHCRNQLDGTLRTGITILDEHLPVERVLANASDAMTWTPPDDAILNNQKERIGKQTVLMAESNHGTNSYRTTLTLSLHRNRIQHRRLIPGLLVLSGTVIILTLIVVLTRWRRPV